MVPGSWFAGPYKAGPCGRAGERRVIAGVLGWFPAIRAPRGDCIGRPPLPALPLRLALFKERADAFLNVLGGEGDRQLRAQEVERVRKRHVLLAEHGVLA